MAIFLSVISNSKYFYINHDEIQEARYIKYLFKLGDFLSHHPCIFCLICWT